MMLSSLLSYGTLVLVLLYAYAGWQIDQCEAVKEKIPTQQWNMNQEIRRLNTSRALILLAVFILWVLNLFYKVQGG